MKNTLFAAIAIGVALVLLVSLVVVRGLPARFLDDSKATRRTPGSRIVQQKVQQKKVDQVGSEKRPRQVSGAQAPPVQRPRGFPKTAFEYAQMCEPELGVPPKVDLDKSVEIPLYVDGVRAYGELFTCDNPTLIGKSSVSGSTLQRYEGKAADGNPLPDVVWVAFGRNSSSSHKHVVGSVQMIGYNKKSGATGFFESSDRIGPWVTLDEETLRMRGEMPWIDEPDEFNKAFVTPGNTQCVQCHQSDPFITNSFINAAKIPGTDESVVPALDAESPYFVIGGENWDMRTIHIQGNACFECHRVGMATIDLFSGSGWDPNQHMPPHDPGSLAEDYRELLFAWRRGPEAVAGAEWMIPPARGQPGQVVGEDYPYQAAFNRTGKGAPRTLPKAGPSPASQEEVARLLKQIPDRSTRKAFDDWFQENGITEEALEKLRSLAEGDPQDDKADDKECLETRPQESPQERQGGQEVK
tara:strand:+ start:175 stop:1581 length:1407 start_codon:yes stop_codon:yes gene_type:complete